MIRQSKNQLGTGVDGLGIGRMLSIIIDEEQFETIGPKALKCLDATHLMKCHVMKKDTDDVTALGSTSLQEALAFLHGHASTDLGLFTIGERAKSLVTFAVGSGLVPAGCVIQDNEERLESILALRIAMLEKEAGDIVDCGGI